MNSQPLPSTKKNKSFPSTIRSEKRMVGLGRIGSDPKPAQQCPILVTGAHRSGTTWASSMLNLAPGTIMTEEPMNVMPHRYAFDGLARDYFTYAPELPPEKARKAFEKIISRETGKVFSRKTPQRYFKFTRQGRYIIKDPIACLSSDWLSKNFDLNVLVLVRHPCAFVASLKRMDWVPDLDTFFSQPSLLAAYLEDICEDTRDKDLNFHEKAAYAWKIIYRVLNDFQTKHPEWIFKTHEELSFDPESEFKTLYEKFGLEWNDDVRKGIAEHTSPQNNAEAKSGTVHTLKRDSRSIVNSWKSKLRAEQIERIKQITCPEWINWYEESSWT